MLPPVLNGCPNCKKSPNLVTLIMISKKTYPSAGLLFLRHILKRFQTCLDHWSRIWGKIIGLVSVVSTYQMIWALVGRNSRFWSWHSWQRGCFQHKRSPHWIHSLANYIYCQLFWNRVKELESGNGSISKLSIKVFKLDFLHFLKKKFYNIDHMDGQIKKYPVLERTCSWSTCTRSRPDWRWAWCKSQTSPSWRIPRDPRACQWCRGKMLGRPILLRESHSRWRWLHVSC